MTTLILAYLLTSPQEQLIASDHYCAALPLQEAANVSECNPVLAKRNRDVSKFLFKVESDRQGSLFAPVTPFSEPDPSNPFQE